MLTRRGLDSRGEGRFQSCLEFLCANHRRHFFESWLFSHMNNYLPIKIIKIYFDKSKFSKYIFMPLNWSMLAQEMANITFWHSKIAKINFSYEKYTHLVYYFTLHFVVYFILADCQYYLRYGQMTTFTRRNLMQLLSIALSAHSATTNQQFTAISQPTYTFYVRKSIHDRT